jgi:O-antigen/teichoic acid export membrane protein
MQLSGIFQATLYSRNLFRLSFLTDFLFQTFRIVLVVSVIYITGELGLSADLLTALIFLAVGFSYLLSLAIMISPFFSFFKQLISSSTKLSLAQKKEVRKFLVGMALVGLSGTLFGVVDRVMLGMYVSPQFIGYHAVALMIAGSASVFVSFFSTALLPLFSSTSGNERLKLLRKGMLGVIGLGFLFTLLLFSFSSPIVLLVYGSDYFSAIALLRFASPLVLVYSIASILSTYLLSRAKLVQVSLSLIGSLACNILLNRLFIKYSTSMMGSSQGVIVATLISQIVYILFLYFAFRKLKFE